ncbi:hypothetical protein HV183_05270 [Citrobacter freundii]|uniref:Uncharacterized protein n=1 Tax=Citrobacter freundii TaxID=546 RepID=A0AAE7GP29_CITFR|nr:hypothetical protein HV183_05270 [Citrobacter freundii]
MLRRRIDTFGIVALSALFFDLVTATALINFGALVAFTFVNLTGRFRKPPLQFDAAKFERVWE